jgi:hypothetical protein
MDYELDGRDSIPGNGKTYFFPHSFQTGSGAHHASYPKGDSGPFPRVKTAGGLKLTTNLHLLPWSKMKLYLHFLVRLHGLVFNHISSWADKPFLIVLFKSLLQIIYHLVDLW